MCNKSIDISRGIGLVVNPQKEHVVEYTRIFTDYAQKNGLKYYINERATAKAIGQLDHYMPAEDFTSHIGVAFSLGGDGTLLRTVRSLDKSGVPVLGVNFGTLGFLTGTSPHHPKHIFDIIASGDFDIEHRLAIECFLPGNKSSVALNDVVISRETIARLFEIEVSINGEYLTTFVADGLIISTPTGSTAHSLSAGGPILSPNTKVILLTPICPHTLTNRPLIVDKSSEIKISLKSSTKDALITIDGQQVFSIRQNEHFIIKVAPYFIKLITLQKHSYYEILRRKLNWGER